MTRAVTIGFVVLVAFLALVSTGCGGDDEPEATATEEWANSLCTTITSWKDELERIGDDVTSSPSTEGLEQAADDVRTATDDFVEELRDLGGPDTESGDAIEDAVQEFADTAEAEKAKVEEVVDDISGLGDITSALSAVSGSLQTMATALDTLFDTFDAEDPGGEVQTAVEQSPACDELTS